MIQVLDQEGNPRNGILSSPRCKLLVSATKLKRVMFGEEAYASTGKPVKIDVDLSSGNEWTIIRKRIELVVICADNEYLPIMDLMVAKPAPRFKLYPKDASPVISGRPVLKSGPACLIFEFEAPLRQAPVVDVFSGEAAIFKGLQSSDEGEAKYSLSFTVPKDAIEGLAFAVPHGVELDGHRF